MDFPRSRRADAITREPVQVKAKKRPFFKCGKALSERVDYRENNGQGGK